jgi:hypothetical protein
VDPFFEIFGKKLIFERGYPQKIKNLAFLQHMACDMSLDRKFSGD